jgi:hypothetical protein
MTMTKDQAEKLFTTITFSMEFSDFFYYVADKAGQDFANELYSAIQEVVEEKLNTLVSKGGDEDG